MNRRRLSPRLRIQALGFFMLLGLAALGLRLWWVQVARGSEWTSQVRGSSEATVRIPSVRGEIRDRNGLSLVQNRASYEVDFYLPEMVKGYRQRIGPPPLTEYPLPSELQPWERIFADAVVNNDDHVIKMTYTCYSEGAHYRNKLYHAAAARLVAIGRS